MPRTAKVWKDEKTTCSTDIPPSVSWTKIFAGKQKGHCQVFKKGMAKKCSDHHDLFGEFQGKKEILASVMYLSALGSHHRGHLHKNYPTHQSGKTFARQIVRPGRERHCLSIVPAIT